MAGTSISQTPPAEPYLIPAPADFQDRSSQGNFIWSLTAIVALPDGTGKPAMDAYSRWLQSREWPEEWWEEFNVGSSITGEVDQAIKDPEGYRLEIDRNGARIMAGGEAGFFYGMQSLIQLIERGLRGSRSVVPGCVINDAPAFAWRGMHLDVSRHFFPLDSIKKYIDWMARYKLNTFHWHLTDDQGWRLEIDAFPGLQEVSAWRDETLIGHYSEQPHQFDGRRYGGYYTKEEARELIQYAAERQINIVPEIEMPGHARAALAAYPKLSCTGDSLPVATKWGVFDEVFCTRENTFEFLFSVLDELVALFPGQYIHIGGDECPKTKWKACPVCQSNISEHDLGGEDGLQSWFVGRIDSFLTARGKSMIGWDEIMEGGLSPNAGVMAWRGAAAAEEAAREGHPVVLCPTSHAYFDYYQSDAPGEPLAIGGHLPLEKVYSLQPVSDAMSPAEAKWVLGVQGNIWTEYLQDFDQVEYMAFPRMLAMSEVSWTGASRPEFQDFARRVVRHFPVMDAAGVDHGTQLLEPDIWVQPGEKGLYFHAEKFLDEGTLRFTKDGTVPGPRSREYLKPQRISKPAIVQCALFNGREKPGPVRSLTISPDAGSKAKISGTPPSPSYSGLGLATLINGVGPPSLKHGGREWLGWWKVSPQLQLNWSKPVKADSIHVQFYRSEGSWIYLPDRIEYRLNGGQPMSDITIRKGEGNTWWYSFPVGRPTKLQKLELSFFPLSRIPDGAQGAGNPAWIFAGQIRLE